MRSVILWTIGIICLVAFIVTNTAYPILSFLLVGNIPGTEITLSSSTMLAILIAIGAIVAARTIWLLIGFVRQSSLAYKQQRRLPRRRYQV